MHTLFAMGGYGIYVWPCYGITLLVFGMNVWMKWNERRQIKKMFRQQAME